MPQFNQRSLLNIDQQIVKALINILIRFPKLELIAKLNTFLQIRTYLWNQW